jgi:hypothetical protein
MSGFGVPPRKLTGVLRFHRHRVVRYVDQSLVPALAEQFYFFFILLLTKTLRVLNITNVR